MSCPWDGTRFGPSKMFIVSFYYYSCNVYSNVHTHTSLPLLVFVLCAFGATWVCSTLRLVLQGCSYSRAFYEHHYIGNITVDLGKFVTFCHLKIRNLKRENNWESTNLAASNQPLIPADAGSARLCSSAANFSLKRSLCDGRPSLSIDKQ